MPEAFFLIEEGQKAQVILLTWDNLDLPSYWGISNSVQKTIIIQVQRRFNATTPRDFLYSALMKK